MVHARSRSKLGAITEWLCKEGHEIQCLKGAELHCLMQLTLLVAGRQASPALTLQHRGRAREPHKQVARSLYRELLMAQPCPRVAEFAGKNPSPR